MQTQTINTIGRRKTAVARIYVSDGKGEIIVNGRDFKEYFPIETLQIVINQPFAITESLGSYSIKANIDGGGVKGQAEALRMAIARALVKVSAENKPVLRKEGFITRDSRMVERKKPGRKKARKKFQFSKR